MVDNFRKLEIWQEGLVLVKEIYKLVAKFPKSEQYALKDQLCRAANSVIANIAEAQGRFHYADKVRILYIARGEIFEVRSHLSVASELGYLEEDSFAKLDIKYEDLAKRLSSYINYLERKANEPISK